MASSRDPDELQYYWEQWREKSGKMIKVECLFCRTLLLQIIKNHQNISPENLCNNPENMCNICQGNYHEYIDLYNEAAKLNGFSDASMMKVDPYESKTFIQEMEDTWQVWIEI